MNPGLIRGLYALIDPSWAPAERLVESTAAAIRGGARLIQYRDKTASPAERAERGRVVYAECRRAGAIFIVNDDIELAFELMAHGVHLGEMDATIASARARLGPLAIVGASCYDSVVNAQRAADAGASYVAFGAFHPTRTKPNARQAEHFLLRKARALGLPLVAIGGITPENGGELVAEGADALAVASGLAGPEGVEARARRYAALFERAVD